MATARDEPAPLSARSTILSLMLGAHPNPLTPADLARAGQFFGIAPATVRVAAARAVSDGDLSRTDAGYRLGERLVQRQVHQDEAVHVADKPWDGSWEMAVVVTTGRPGPERAVLRDALKAHRLAELREGVWTRPANLQRPHFSDPVLRTFTSMPEQDPRDLAASLWDLAGWTREAEHLLERLASTPEPALRLATAAAIVRHLSADPLLPRELRPPSWPAASLRETYRAYQRELSELAALPS
ncbi:PaaX family transcriptional regulator C-terminal domain-containing protein [Nocardioides sp. NPDC051685]|uniref:PaaX family transcriptional regulator C-terminal domain-containing protein n=1 Tax=Nocardioides sp. NPDC051685 TaxID=3364334 RepID=UPI003788C3A1